MDISYIYTQKRKEFGKPCSFTDIGPNLIADIDPDEELKDRFYVIPFVDKEVDNSVKMCVQEVNTVSHPSESRGMSHVEGGWPAGIDLTDDESMMRFRKKIEKDKNYTNAVKSLGATIENYIMKNNSLDIYEEYFDSKRSGSGENSFVTLNVVSDPSETSRRVLNTSWSADSSKFTGAYTLEGIEDPPEDACLDSYVWDLQSCTEPFCVLKADCCLNCVEFSPTDVNLLVGGYVSGPIALWDIRVGGAPQQLTDIKEGHKQKVVGVKWCESESKMELLSASLDGQLMSWDARHLSKPTISVNLNPDSDGSETNEQPYTVSCNEYNSELPDVFMVGTEQGQVMSCALNDDTKLEVILQTFDCQNGSILTIKRNNLCPQVFAACNPWATTIWSDDSPYSPVLKLESKEGFYTDLVWSPKRGSTLFIANTLGTVEVWDVPGKNSDPVSTFKLDNNPICSVSISQSGEYLACGGGSGKLHIIRLPEHLKSITEDEKKAIKSAMANKK